MSIVTANLAISLDGFTAGPNQSAERPFGTGADALTAWMFQTDQPGRETDKQILVDVHANIGVHVMGRNMFGPGRGEWDLDWTGWWGDDPPYHAPVFVLTHHERAPLPMQGGTTFTFVTDGIESALERAREAAGSQDVEIASGAATVRQYLAAGLLNGLTLEPVEVIASSAVTHLRYRVPR